MFDCWFLICSFLSINFSGTPWGMTHHVDWLEMTGKTAITKHCIFVWLPTQHDSGRSPIEDFSQLETSISVAFLGFWGGVGVPKAHGPVYWERPQVPGWDIFGEGVLTATWSYEEWQEWLWSDQLLQWPIYIYIINYEFAGRFSKGMNLC